MRDPFDLRLTPDQWVDSPLAGQLIEVAGIGIQGIARGGGLTPFFVLHFRVGLGVSTMPRHLGNAMGDEVDHVDTRYALLLEQEYRLAFLLAEDRHQHIGASHFALAGTLHMKYRALQHALEAQGRLGFALFVMLGDQWRGGVDEFLQVMPEFLEIGATCAQHAGCRIVIQ